MDEKEFYNWFKKNSPLCGKVKTMQKICDAFPDNVFTIRNSWPPYALSKYNTEAAKLMNKWKQEGKIVAKKKGRSYCYSVVE